MQVTHLEWWQILIGIVVGLIVLTILVVLHELGHALSARRHGVEVEEFGVGFPPRAKKMGQVGKTEVTLNWLPLGGFCKMKGESDDAKEKASYGAASLWAKSEILLAGVVVNFVTACILFAILAVIGMPKMFSNQFTINGDNYGSKGIVAIHDIVKGSAADKAGLKVGDDIVSVNGKIVEVSSELPAITKSEAGKRIAVTIGRDKKNRLINVDLANHASGKSNLGVATIQKKQATIRATWSAPIIGITTASQVFWETLSMLGGMLSHLFTGLWGLVTSSPVAKSNLNDAQQGVAGPVGILGQIFPIAVAGGFESLLFISAIISVSLAVMNLLPIPGLDGGRLYLTLWYRLRRKTLTKEREEKIVGSGMLFLFALIIIITIIDISKYFIK